MATTKYRTLFPLLLVTLTFFACSDDSSPTSPGFTAPPTQNLFVLSGTVTSSGAALAGASVTIMDGVNKGHGRITDAAGTFSFTNLTPSSFTVQATAAGYTPQNRAVNLTSDQSVTFALVKINPIFLQTGSGDTVFDMPTYVRRVRIQATYTGYSSNFIVRIASSLVVNELIGTGWGTTTFDGTYLTLGGVTQITNSSGVNWTFTEVR